MGRGGAEDQALERKAEQWLLPALLFHDGARVSDNAVFCLWLQSLPRGKHTVFCIPGVPMSLKCPRSCQLTVRMNRHVVAEGHFRDFVFFQ